MNNKDNQQADLIEQAKKWLLSNDGEKSLSDSMHNLEVMKFELFKASKVQTKHLHEPFITLLADFAIRQVNNETVTITKAEIVALRLDAERFQFISNYLSSFGYLPQNVTRMLRDTRGTLKELIEAIDKARTQS